MHTVIMHTQYTYFILFKSRIKKEFIDTYLPKEATLYSVMMINLNNVFGLYFGPKN